MSEPLTAVPKAWVERLFSRFQATYGNRFAVMWRDSDEDETKALWAEELARFDPADIRSAIELLRYAHLDYPPTLYEFGNLCRDAQRKRTQIVAALTGPRTEMPEHIKQQFAVFKAKYHA